MILSGFIGLGDERKGGTLVKVMASINCFTFIFYTFSTAVLSPDLQSNLL